MSGSHIRNVVMLALVALAGIAFTSTPVLAALWTPALTNTALWLDAADASTVLTSGSSVINWLDKSGNSRHVKQATVSRQPTSDSDTLNGLNVLAFDGSDYLTNTFGATLSRPNSIFLVARVDVTNASSHVFFDGFDGANQHMFYSYIGIFHMFNGGAQPATSADTNYHSFATVWGSSTLELFVDGVSKSTTSSGTENLAGITVGAKNGGGEPLDGRMGEMIIIDGLASDEDREIIEGYLAWKWGLQDNLPGSHPHKDAPPTIPDAGTVILIR